MRPRPSTSPLTLALAALLAWPATASAVDAVTGASKRQQETGNQNAALWIVGRGFAPGLTVIISGDGITEQRAPTVVAEAERIDGGRGDGIAYYFSVAPDATLGPRDITVRGADGSTATGMGIIEIVAGAPPDPDPPPPDPEADAGVPEPPPDDRPQQGKVEFISRASPEYGERGAQVNLWIVGRSFIPGVQVEFSADGLGPAVVEERTIPLEVVRNPESEDEGLDGIQYFLQIPPDAMLGPVDVTVTSPDGSTATGMGMFDILPPGEMPPPDPGAGNVDAITGASPQAGRAGRNLSLWLWGDGFATGATVRFSSPSIRPYAEPEVVEETTSNPGFSGIRNYLFVEEGALPGPVDVTVTNPNGTTVTAEALFEIIDTRGSVPGAPGGGAGTDEGCDRPDVLTSVESLDRVVPTELARGETVNLAIQGRAFACGASVVISGGGLSAVGAPRLVRDPADPLLTTLFWQIQVAEDAPIGPRDVTVINPNNTSKALRAAMSIVETRGDGDASSGSGSFCQSAPGGGAGWWLLLPFGLALRRRR